MAERHEREIEADYEAWKLLLEKMTSSVVEAVGIPDLLGNSNIEFLSPLDVGLSELLVPGKWQSGFF